MSVPQGNISLAYFDNVNLQVEATFTCAGLQRISTEVTTSVNSTVSAVNSQLSLINSDFAALANSIAALNAQIATLAGSQAAFTAVNTQALTVSAVVDLPTAIAYLHAQSPALATLGTTNALTFVKQAVTLGQDLINVTTAYNRLQAQITSLTALAADFPARLATITSNIAAKAAQIPNCTIT